MNCPSCSHHNPDAARFCNACGAPLAPRCQTCGTDNPPGARFCNGCGAPLAMGPAAVETRKVVTIVFADPIGSTSLHERLDPESVSRLMDRYPVHGRRPRARARRPRMCAAKANPITRREKTSITVAKYSQPSHVGM
jgi:hypothetical protein